ncbi:cytochrome-c peroxidase [Paracoccus sp. (in: a-proteobacteria)]|uniref:cytochrome-c peroxidase n=1 Tax=Paracoccus sp. TaxID=267 RepID=UPI002AFF43DA|nr:cytochrome c peroxidase [Paracoccus sp. (in: a-proteobacteria)]
MTLLRPIWVLVIPLLLAGAVGMVGAAAGRDQQALNGNPTPELAQLGQHLFHDVALSRGGTQSCATCHDPEHAFTDPREGAAGRAVSLGDDGMSYGDRNTPTLSYAALSPVFHRDDKGRYKGGQFWDGRADDLEDQAGQPMLNPVEMAMVDKAAVVGRLREDPAYRESFAALFGPDALNDVGQAFERITAALAAYQRGEEFLPFDSKFDRWQRGEATLTAQEEFGYTVFLTWNCRLCHQLQKQGVVQRETFTSFEFHNIGVPVNPAARTASGLGPDHVDLGLLARPDIDDPAQAGRIKVPTLRNVAVTGPYMHNGVFQDLRTAVLFYNKYTSRRPVSRINPETGEDWGTPEVAENLSLAELQSGLMLDGARVDALVAFLETLTDQRYEPLLAEQKRAQEEVAQSD